MTKKHLGALSIIAALVLAPALNAAAAKAEAKPEAKPEPKVEPKSAAKADEKAADAKENEAEAKDKGADEKSKTEVHHKSPALAGFLGFVPGVAVHGAGHMYAGSWMKGFGLLAVEAASIGIIAANVSTIQADVDSISKTNNGVPTDLSVPYTKLGIITVSSMAFLWSWWDDMAGAPIAVSEYNKIQDQDASASLQLAPRGDGVQVALSTPF